MNILFYLYRFPGIGGIETVSEMIGDGLRNHGHQIYYLSHVQEGRAEDDRICFSMPDAVCLAGKRNIDFSVGLVKRLGCDCVVYQYNYAAVEHVAVQMASCCHIPLLVFEHNTPLCVLRTRFQPIYTPKGFLQQARFRINLSRHLRRRRALMEACRTYFLLSEAYLPELRRLVGDRYESKWAVLPNPVRIPDAVSFREKEPVILCVCQLVPQKNVDWMLDAWSIVSMHLPRWKFIIVGDGPEKERLQRRVQEEQIPRISFAGYAAPGRYYEKASIFWMASLFEGLPMTLLESISYGCVPIVVETFSSLRDVVADGRNGVIIDKQDMGRFVEATLEMAMSSERRECMGRQGILDIERFDIGRILGQWETILRQL